MSEYDTGSPSSESYSSSTSESPVSHTSHDSSPTHTSTPHETTALTPTPIPSLTTETPTVTHEPSPHVVQIPHQTAQDNNEIMATPLADTGIFAWISTITQGFTSRLWGDNQEKKTVPLPSKNKAPTSSRPPLDNFRLK